MAQALYDRGKKARLRKIGGNVGGWPMVQRPTCCGAARLPFLGIVLGKTLPAKCGAVSNQGAKVLQVTGAS